MPKLKNKKPQLDNHILVYLKAGLGNRLSLTPNLMPAILFCKLEGQRKMMMISMKVNCIKIRQIVSTY